MLYQYDNYNNNYIGYTIGLIIRTSNNWNFADVQ